MVATFAVAGVLLGREVETMSEQIICRACKKVVPRDVHRVRIILVNAGRGAPREQVDKEDDFHLSCAAYLFRAFEGERE